MKRLIFGLLLAAALPGVGLAGVHPAEGFAKRVTFEVTDAAGSAALANFPVLVRLSESSISGFKYADCAADGSDLRFVDNQENVLPFEIDTWDPSGVSLVWVKLPTLAAGTRLIALYGNDSPWEAPSVATLWSDYVGVYHYRETAVSSAVTVADSSGTQDGTADSRSIVTAGPIGNARGRTDATGSNGAMMSVAKTDALDSLVPTFTVSTWLRPEVDAMSWAYLFGRKAKDQTSAWGCQIGIASGFDVIRLHTNGTIGQPGNYAEFNTSTALAAGKWAKLDAVYDNTNVLLYVDGQLIAKKEAVPGVAVSGTLPFAVGGLAGSGHGTAKAYFDETRLSAGAKGAEWIALEYLNETGTTLLANSGAVEVDLDAVQFENPPTFAKTPSGYRVTVTLTADSHTGAIYAMCGGEKPYSCATLMTATGKPGETYSAVLTNLPANAMCGFGVKGVSDAATPKETLAYGEGTFLSGEVTVAKTSGASEEQLATPGVFTVSRPDTAAAKKGELVVNYTIGGTAVPGTNYVPLSGSVTIPDGSATATIAVTPMCTWSETTVEVTLADGLYSIGSPASASMEIARRRLAYGFAKRVEFSVAESAGDAALANFPVLVRLSEASVDGFQYSECAADGSDLRFLDVNANPLPFEIDTWDPSGVSLVWVKLPTLVAGVKFSLLYGNGSEQWSAPASTNVWSDYVGVYHYRETAVEAEVTVADASGHQDGTADSRSIVTAGPLGNARGRIDAYGAKGSMMTVPVHAALDTLAPTFTVSTWVQLATNGMNWAYLFARKFADGWGSWGSQFNDSDNLNKLRVYTCGKSFSECAIFDTTGKFTENVWTKLDYVYAGAKLRLYFDGELLAEMDANPAEATNGTENLTIGGLTGTSNTGTARAYFDETRLSVGAKSDEWIALSYANETGAGLLENSGATAVNLDDVRFQGVPTVSWSEEGFRVSATMSVDSPVATVYALCGTEKPYECVTLVTTKSEAGKTCSAVLTNLPANAMCGIAVKGVSTADPSRETLVYGDDVFLSGAVTIEKTADAFAESGGEPGVFTVSRPDVASAKQGELVVNYTVGGTATAGTQYEPLSGSVTIPDGSATATISVATKPYWSTTSLAVTLADGLYAIGSPASATMTLTRGRVTSGFKKGVDYTASAIADDVDLADFPVLVRLSEATVDGFKYADCAADGSDLRFIDGYENILPFEIDTWNTSGTSLVWVKVPRLKRGLKITALYGSDAPWDAPGATSVWSGYAGVYHFAETTAGAIAIADSSGTQDGVAHAKSLVVDGPVGKARGRTDAYGSNGATMTVAQTDALNALVPTFTVSVWVCPYTDQMNWASIFSRQQADGTPSWGCQFRGTSPSGGVGWLGVYTSGTADNDTQRSMFDIGTKLSANVWTKLDVVYDEMKIRMYFDGVLYKEQAAKPDVAKNYTYDFAVGGRLANGYGTAKAYFDETRLSAGVKSDAWIAMAYTNETTGLFANAGVYTPDPDKIRFAETPTIVKTDDGFKVTAKLNEISGPGTLTVHYGTGGAYDLTKTLAASAVANGTYEVVLDDLPEGATYQAFVRGESAAGTLTDAAIDAAFYAGALSVVAPDDVQESSTDPLVFTISRADACSALTVNYTFGGTAVEGVHFTTDATGTLTLADGVSSATVTIAPKFVGKGSHSVVLTTGDGFYTPSSAAMSLVGVKVTRGFKKTVTFTLDGYDGPEELTDIPVPIRLSESAIEGFDYADFKLANGGDLRFTTTAGVPLAAEIDTWDESGESLAWVKLPVLTNGAQVVACWGNARPYTAPNPTSLWNDRYLGVWHMSAIAGGVTEDSTSNGLDLTAKNQAMQVVDSRGGQLGASLVNETASPSSRPNTEGFVSPDYSAVFSSPQFTVSMWYNRRGAYKPSDDERFFSSKTTWDSDGFEVEADNENFRANVRCGTSAASFDAPDFATALWNKLTVVFDGASASVYTNGVLSSVQTVASAEHMRGICFGGMATSAECSLCGSIDEVRMTRSCENSDWIAATYTLEKSDLFTHGEVTKPVQPGGFVIIVQ